MAEALTKREEAARIIDPQTFDLIAHYNGIKNKPEGEDPEVSTFRAYPSLREARDAAFAKADAILALAPPAVGVAEPVARLRGEVTDAWAERFCVAVNWSPDGQECKIVEGEFRCVSFRDLAKGHILAAIATDPCTAHPQPSPDVEVERLKEVIAWANNSLFGSHGFFLSTSGGPDNPHHLDTAIERLKAGANEQWRRAEAAEAKLQAMEEERALDREALQKAEQFIVNGMEFGHVKLPAYSDDPAHLTLPAIRSRLASKGGR